jgi:hypothetical protein
LVVALEHGRTSYRKPPYVDFSRDFTDDVLGVGNGSATIIDSLTAGTAAKRDFAALRIILAADADCRRPAYVAAMRIVAAKLDGWEVRNHAKLRAVRQAWRERVEAAATLPGG